MATSYRYALLGIVGLAALVAVFAIIRTAGLSTPFPEENTIGQVVRLPVQDDEALCGDRDGQTLSCHSERACCGGQCVVLPTCEGEPDGPVFTCGARQMYCCHGALSLQSLCPTIADDSGFGPLLEGEE